MNITENWISDKHDLLDKFLIQNSVWKYNDQKIHKYGNGGLKFQFLCVIKVIDKGIHSAYVWYPVI